MNRFLLLVTIIALGLWLGDLNAQCAVTAAEKTRPGVLMIFVDDLRPSLGCYGDALETSHLAGAGIDVLEQEPPPNDSLVIAAWRDPDHPAHDRTLLNPHTAFYCEEGSKEFRRKGAQEVLRALTGEPIRNMVNGVDSAAFESLTECPTNPVSRDNTPENLQQIQS